MPKTETAAFGPCFSCNASNTFPYLTPEGQTFSLCPACSHRYALWDVAAEQLRAELRPVLLAWVEVWGSVPGMNTLPEALELLGRSIEQERAEASS